MSVAQLASNPNPKNSVDAEGKVFFSRAWMQWLQQVPALLTITLVDAPLTAASPGYPGQVALDSSYFYVAVAQDTWKRVAIATW